jgi:hypothetical protein
MAIQMDYYVMDTFVASCRSVEFAMDLARFLERKFSFNPRIRGEQIHKFNVVVDVADKIQVHSTVAVNDIGREDFKKFVAEFTALKTRKPVQGACLHPGAMLRAA